MAKKQIAGPNVALGGDPSGLHSAVNKAEGDLKRYVTSAQTQGKKARHALDPRGWFGQGGKTGGLMGSLSSKILAGAEKSGSGFVSRFASGMLGGVAKLGGIAGGVGGAGLIGGILTGGVGLAAIAAVGTLVGGITLGVIGMKLAVTGLASAFQSVLSIAERMGSAIVSKMKQQALAIDENAKSADTLRISLEGLAGLQLASSLGGIDPSALTLMLTQLNTQIGAAQMGLKKSKKVFEALDLDYEALAAMDTADAFQTVAERIARIPDPAGRALASIKLFGTDGPKALNMVVAGLGDARAESERLGIGISRLDAARIEQMNDNIERMRTAWAGVADQLLSRVAPYATSALQSILDWIEGDGGIPAKMEAVVAAAADAAQSLYGKAIAGFLELKSTVLDIAAVIVEAWDKVAAIMTGKGTIGGAIAGAVKGAKTGGVIGMVAGGVAGAVSGANDSQAVVAPHAGLAGNLRAKGAEAQKAADAAAKKEASGEYRNTALKWMEMARQKADEAAINAIDKRETILGSGDGFGLGENDEKDKAKKDAAFGTGSLLLKALSIARPRPQAASPGAFDNANSLAWQRPNANFAAWNRGSEPSVAAAPAVSQGKMTSDQLLTKIATGIDKLVRNAEQQGRRPAAVPVMG